MLSDLHFNCLLVGVGDFREGGEKKQDNQQCNEAGYSQIDPLHIFESSIRIHGVCKEDTRSEKWRYKRSDPLDGLGEVQSDFAISWWAANREKATWSTN